MGYPCSLISARARAFIKYLEYHLDVEFRLKMCTVRCALLLLVELVFGLWDVLTLN